MKRILRILYSSDYTGILQEEGQKNKFLLIIGICDYPTETSRNNLIHKIAEQYNITHFSVKGVNAIERNNKR